MKKQLPKGVFTIIIVVVALVAAFVIGSFSAPRAESNNPLVGTVAADFTSKDSNGKPFHLADLKGKVVLLNFWATWCGPCVHEIPDLIKLQAKYKDRGFTVVGMNTSDGMEKAKAFATKAKMNYPVVEAVESMREPYGGIEALPTSVLINKEGRIAYVSTGIPQNMSMEEFLKPEIEKCL